MPNKPAKPGSAGQNVGLAIASVLFVAFVVWLVNGVAQGGWVMWFAIALFAAPVVGLLGFYAWIFFAFVLQGRRNVREAQQWHRDHPEGIAPGPEANDTSDKPVRKRRRRSRGNR